MGESEDKRKKTKRALRDALEHVAKSESQPPTPGVGGVEAQKLLGISLEGSVG